MTEKVELSRPLVVGHKRDGRSCYDREAKRELVEACLRPGISIARMALEHGVNANLLRRWIDQYRGVQTPVVAAHPLPLPAFGLVAMLIVSTTMASWMPKWSMAANSFSGVFGWPGAVWSQFPR